MENTAPIKKDVAEFLVEHYQKTYELTQELWRERNNIFLILVAVLAAASLFLSLGQAQANSLLLVWVGRTLGLSEAQISALQKSANFDLLQLLVLATVFYLMVNLYHRTQSVLRLYQYLGKLEEEIRAQLGLGSDSIAFSRESTFYWAKRPRLMGLVGVVYIIILFVLLGGFLALRLSDDWRTGLSLLKVADFVLAIAIALYFVGYTLTSMKS